MRQQNKSEELQKLKECVVMSHEEQQARYVQLAEERSSRASAAAAQAQESSLVKRKERALTQSSNKSIISRLNYLIEGRSPRLGLPRLDQEKLQVERALVASSKASIRGGGSDVGQEKKTG